MLVNRLSVCLSVELFVSNILELWQLFDQSDCPYLSSLSLTVIMILNMSRMISNQYSGGFVSKVLQYLRRFQTTKNFLSNSKAKFQSLMILTIRVLLHLLRHITQVNVHRFFYSSAWSFYISFLLIEASYPVLHL